MSGPAASRSRTGASASRASTSAALKCEPTPMPEQMSTLPRKVSPISMPARMAACAWSSVIALPMRALRVPCAILRNSRRSWETMFSATPQSTTVSAICWMRANTAIGNRPLSRCSTCSKVGCWPRRNDAVHGHAVVGGEDHQLRIAKPRLERVLHQPQAHGQRFEFAQAARCLGAARQLLEQRALEQRVRGGGDERATDGHGGAV